MKLAGPLSEEQERQLKTIQASSRHLLSLINDLLDLAKIESGKVEISLESVSVQKLVEEVATTLGPLAEQKRLKFEVQVPLKEIVLRSDWRALQQILLNLTNNAIKFTEKGSVRLELHQREINGATQTEFVVTDTGIGIRPEDKDRLFQAFSQVGSTGSRREGTGLGLHLSQKLAELLGGTITFESEYGKGTRFQLSLQEGRGDGKLYACAHSGN